jgi:uncharacterized membrane protein YkvA (DUF1232 family)
VSWLSILLGVGVGLAVVWLLLVATLYALGRRHGEPTTLRDALRLLPDTVRLLRRITVDRSVPRHVRVRVVLLLAYLALPVDLVPDFVPVVGLADDIIVLALVLRSVVRRAGPDVLERHWPGSPEGLRTIKQLAGLRL